MATRTPGIGALDSPLTVPVTDPPTICALVVEGASGTNAISATSKTSVSLKLIERGLLRELFQRMGRPTGNIWSSIAEFNDCIRKAVFLLISRLQYFWSMPDEDS